MRVSTILEEEQSRLSKEFLEKLQFKGEETEIMFKDLIDKAIEQEIFNIDTYCFSDDEDYLFDLLNFSVGLSHLWRDYKDENPKADFMEINKVLIRYMINMYGVKKIIIEGKLDENVSETNL